MRHLLLSSLVVIAASTAAIGQSDIRKVDFKNFTYLAHCISEKPSKITVKDGEFSREKQEDGYVDRFYFNVFDVAYGDLTGDGRDEAIVLGACNTGGTGNFSEGFVFSMKGPRPSLVARIPGGDRAYGGLRNTRVEGGLLVVESNDVGPEGGACCPQVIVTTKYKVAAGKIVKAGKEVRRVLYPTERVTFARGTSSKTIRITIPREEGKRFIIGARSGQTLNVSVDTDKASLRLLGDAEVTSGPNSLLVNLPKNGDYTVEVQNDSDAELAITMVIKIQ
ncbi:MAG: hypothetical protein ABI481_02415 [Pyrinomonadaceae bacterium]